MSDEFRRNLIGPEPTLLAELEPCARTRQQLVPRVEQSPADLDEGSATRKHRTARDGGLYVNRLIDGFDGVLADLDGVVYTGSHAIEGATKALDRLAGEGKSLAYVTNNASRSSEEVATHLREIGAPATAEQVFGSALAGAELLAGEVAAGASVLEAAHLGNYAAGIEVGKRGVATVSPDEVLKVHEESHDQIGRLRRGGLI